MANGDDTQNDLIDYNRKFKKAILDVMFKEAETFYVHCLPNPRLFIGGRGLMKKEKEEGIILVFGPYSTRHLSWDDSFVYCEMQFGKWENVSIPFECISRMFDKSGQVIMQWATMIASEETASPLHEIGSATSSSQGNLESILPLSTETTEIKMTDDSEEKTDTPDDSRVIEVDFTQKKPKK